MAAAKIDAIALLKADHRKVADLFEKFEAAKSHNRKQKLAIEICTELTVHTRIEEEVFYPACHDQIKDEDILNESYVEHDGAKVLIAEVEASGADADFFDAKVKVLSEQIKHHVEEEEKRSAGLFAQAKAAGLDLVELGARMQARKKELLAEIKSSGLSAPETRTFIGHDLPKGAPIGVQGQP
jgi:hypothetical protein